MNPEKYIAFLESDADEHIHRGIVERDGLQKGLPGVTVATSPLIEMNHVSNRRTSCYMAPSLTVGQPSLLSPQVIVCFLYGCCDLHTSSVCAAEPFVSQARPPASQSSPAEVFCEWSGEQRDNFAFRPTFPML